MSSGGSEVTCPLLVCLLVKHTSSQRGPSPVAGACIASRGATNWLQEAKYLPESALANELLISPQCKRDRPIHWIGGDMLKT